MSDDKTPLGSLKRMSGDKTPQKDIFQDKDKLLEIWKDERRSRDFNATLMWENIKLFSVLIPAIITVDTFFLGFILSNSLPGYYAVVTLVFPGLVIGLSWFGFSDLKRRWDRTLEAIAHLNKLEGLLGLHTPRENKFVFKNDSHLFQRWYDSLKDKTGEDIGTERDFIDKKMYEGNMYNAMRNVYRVFGILGNILVVPPAIYLLTLGQ